MSSKETAFFIKRSRQKQVEKQVICYDDFSKFLKAKNIWEDTIEQYIKQLGKFCEWIRENKGKAPEAAEKKDILDYLQVIQHLSASTRQHKLAIIGHYYTFLYQRGQIQSNPTTGIELRGAKKTILPKVLTLPEMEELLDTHFVLKVQNATLERTNDKGQFLSPRYLHQRNHLILSLCIYQGLNKSEWRSLTLDDIDLQKATVSVKAQRKTNARILPLHATQIGIFYAYLYEARTHFNLEGKTLLSPKFQPDLWLKELRISFPNFEDLTQLRASIITHWIKTEGLRKAQYKAGHRYISSTERYLANDLESLKEDIARFHPI